MVFASVSFRFLLLVSLATAILSPARGQTGEWEPAPLEEALDLLDERADWRRWDPVEFPRHPAEKFLDGWVIVLDPGHGGGAYQPNYKRGPTGVREAEINWRVGVLLERLLLDAGVHVVMTRSGDHDVSLAERAEIANTAKRPDGGVGADLFISLHHNATGNPETNYTSVWHHGQVDWSEPDIDVARYLAHSLFRHLRTDAGLTSYMMSDQLMYPSGFGVLSRTRVPAILLETSFHTNPKEEQRLRDARYNLREAYAIYTGLCEYAYGGRPTQSEPEITIQETKVHLTTEIDDGLPKNWWGADRNRTISSSVQVFLDDEPVSSQYDPEKKILTATLPIESKPATAKSDGYVLRIHHANLAKHHNWPQRYRVNFERKNESIQASVRPLGARRTREVPMTEGWHAAADEANAGESAEAPATDPFTLEETTISQIRQAKPGDIVVANELDAQEVPVLPVRLTAEPGPQLVFSDMPEYFRTGDGVALEETVKPGLVRLYLYHVPEPSDAPKVITAMIENLGDKPMTLKFQRYSFPKPSGHYHKVAKTALLDFFRKNSGPAPRQIAPGELVAIDPQMDRTVVHKDQLVHGFYEFEIDQPARIVTLQRSPDADRAAIVDELPRLPRILPDTQASGAGRGRFAISNFLVTRPAEKPVDTADGPGQLIIADGSRDPWIVGSDSIAGDTVENKGNYGVVYRIRLKRTSSDGRSLALFMHNRYSGDQPCGYQASAVQIRAGQRDEITVPVPGEAVGFRNPSENVLLQTFPPLPEGESETIEILYSPPGASCLPTPLYFVPF